MIHVIPEGKTEEKVVMKILYDKQYRILKGEGKSEIAPKLRAVIVPNKAVPLRCMILRDLDAHEGETKERIRQSIQGTLQRIVRELDDGMQKPELESMATYNNVFTAILTQPDIRLAVHIATYRWQDSFIKSTIDDYVLALALRLPVVTAIKKKNWDDVEPTDIIRKVTEEIPALLKQNHIPLQEAKDYVRLYAAVMQLHTSPRVFAEKVLANAPEKDIDDVFASLQAAVDFLGGKDVI